MINIPETNKERVVIAGCGFAGLTLAKKLKSSCFQVIVIDKHNYHQFPPLFYQVASAGLEAASILFPIRKIFHNYADFYIRKAEIQRIDAASNTVFTSEGELKFDHMVLAIGATNNFFNSSGIAENAKGMKTIAEVIDLRNNILMNFEKALVASDEKERDSHLNIVIVGGGPSGVEISGALAEMNRYVVPKDFPELRKDRARIYLIEASDRLLNIMSEKSSEKAKTFLEKSGVRVLTGTKVLTCSAEGVETDREGFINSRLIIWTAGIKGNVIAGLDPGVYVKNGRIKVDRKSLIAGTKNIYALGDLAFMTEEKYPKGHPQVAQVAIQQAANLASNLKASKKGKAQRDFRYRDLGTMATVGKNLAVVELPIIHFHGIFAWFVWMFIHLMSIVGVKNKLMIFINWAWKYLTYDQSLRLILRPKGHN
jgi:NADH dehydrogenase